MCLVPIPITLQETITVNVPYHELKDPAVYVAIVLKKQVPGRPEEHLPTDSKRDNMLWSLLEWCWAFESKRRPSAKQVRDEVSILLSKAICMSPPADNVNLIITQMYQINNMADPVCALQNSGLL